ncbi:unnamed protein product [Rotaria sp. Silwood2]|nr:unnamed protein product [Rotaria sp. Silwood2]CAF4430857.1 unnamed protein product [Rotaria sp. Silwood2]
MNVDANEDKDSLTIENIIFAGLGHKVCIICRSKEHADSVVMPKAASLLQEASSAARLDFMDPCLTNEDYLA